MSCLESYGFVKDLKQIKKSVANFEYYIDEIIDDVTEYDDVISLADDVSEDLQDYINDKLLQRCATDKNKWPLFLNADVIVINEDKSVQKGYIREFDYDTQTITISLIREDHTIKKELKVNPDFTQKNVFLVEQNKAPKLEKVKQKIIDSNIRALKHLAMFKKYSKNPSNENAINNLDLFKTLITDELNQVIINAKFMFYNIKDKNGKTLYADARVRTDDHYTGIVNNFIGGKAYILWDCEEHINWDLAHIEIIEDK